MDVGKRVGEEESERSLTLALLRRVLALKTTSTLAEYGRSMI